MLTNNWKLNNLLLSYTKKRRDMTKMFVRLGVLSLAMIVGISGVSQEFDPVDWSFDVKQRGDEATLIMTAQIEEGWHVYSQFQDYEDGPLPTEFNFNEETEFVLLEGVQEPDSKITKYDPNFELNLRTYQSNTKFQGEKPWEYPQATEYFNPAGTDKTSFAHAH